MTAYHVREVDVFRLKQLKPPDADESSVSIFKYSICIGRDVRLVRSREFYTSMLKLMKAPFDSFQTLVLQFHFSNYSA